jgi:hypothetical protein
VVVDPALPRQGQKAVVREAGLRCSFAGIVALLLWIAEEESIGESCPGFRSSKVGAHSTTGQDHKS